MKKLLIKTQKELVAIPIEDILYITQDKRRLRIMTKDKEYLEYEKLAEIRDKLGDEFYNALKYTIINLNEVYSFTDGKVIFKNGLIFPMGRDCNNRAKKAFIDYIEKLNEK